MADQLMSDQAAYNILQHYHDEFADDLQQLISDHGDDEAKKIIGDLIIGAVRHIVVSNTEKKKVIYASDAARKEAGKS